MIRRTSSPFALASQLYVVVLHLTTLSLTLSHLQMALGAMASDPNLRVKICPVGLSYFHAHKFRSRAVVEFGNALDVPPELVVQYAKGGKDKREACAALLEMILQALKSVTLRAPDYETLTVSRCSPSLTRAREL